MTVEKLDSRSLIAALDSHEMENLGLEDEDFSLENERSRKIILYLARLACLSAGVSTDGKRLSIDIFLLAGGCWLLIAAAPKTFKLKRLAKRSENGCVCRKFFEVSDFLTAAELLYRQGICCTHAAAYELNGEYYLIFGYNSLPEGVMRILSEYSQSVKSAARVRELGKVICPENAVEVIGSRLI